MTKLLTPAEVEQERVQSMARVFTRVNRVLTGQDVWCEVKTDHTMHAPAWSNGRAVTFNMAHIGSVTSTEDIIKITGLNYHELSHIMFTPRAGSTLRDKIVNAGLARVFNVLEDQRIETLLTAMYPATKPYFTTTFMKYCLADQSQWQTVHVLAYGRRYLPESIRKQFEGRYERQEDIEDINRIIDEYRMLTFPRDGDRAIVLLTEFARLLQNMSVMPSDPNGHNAGRPEVEKGKPLSQRDQDDAKEWAEWYDEEDEEPEDEGDGDSDSGSEDDDSEDGSDGDGDGDGGAGEGDDSDEEGASSGGKGEAGDDKIESEGGEDDADDADGSGHGNGAGLSGDGQATDEELQKVMEELVKKTESSKQVQDEVRQKQAGIVSGDGEYGRGLPRAKYRYNDVDPMIANVSKKFARELERLRADLDPGWNRHQASGRLNIGRAMNADKLDLDTVWDRWEEGHNERADIECVLYVDSSSSMMTRDMDDACQAAWAIKRAIESIQGTVTVLSFNTSCYQLFDKNDLAESGRYRFTASTGGTNPSSAIHESFKIFGASKRRTKIAIFVSDGGWSMGDKMVIRLNENGIVTAHATIGGWGGVVTHNCHIAEKIETATDLIPFARRVVTQVMKGK